MLGPLVLHRVGGEVDGTDVVAVDQRALKKRVMELGQELAEPRGLGHAIGHGTVLRLGTGAGGHLLTLGQPGHQVAAQEDSVARGGASSIWTSCPISINIDNHLGGGGPSVKEQAVAHSASEVAEEALEGSEVRLLRIMHMKAQLLNCISDVRPSEGEVLESTRETLVHCGIRHLVPVGLRQLALRVNWSGAGVAIGHPSSLKDVKSVLPLVKKKSSRIRCNYDPKEVVEHTQILHSKFLL
jgi:hypothetical protein